ncbi:SLAM family member 9 [Salmo salar]|uniref:SLAM family member 9 n=1 Tax=Salmo salar TaxID=8030 RepID=A0A1S3SEK7_SALSA|nr:SLAM family member 9 [Salmo salar]|eukprot:XP_014062779.1 PREDICTED: SLAM family member 9-like [Salmo salar]
MPDFIAYTSTMNISWFLLILTGTWAEVPSIYKYGVKGGFVCLAVAESPEEHKELKWKFKSAVIVDNKEISPQYKDKVHYNPVNHSLCIKNLKETDSGIYYPIVGKWNLETIIEYNVTILEAVSIPVMKVVSLYSNSSTGQCNITVNCSVEDVWALSVCNGRHCTLSQQSLTVVNITISNDNNTIQCTGKNHVSAKTKSQPMKDICIEKDGKASEFPVGIIVVSVTAGLLFISVIVGICVGIRRIKSTRRRARKNKQPLQVNPVSAPQGERPGPQNTGGSDVTTIYVTVVKPGAAGVELPSPEEMSETQSEALYSTVQHPAAEESHLVDKVGATKEDRPGPQSPTETEPTSIYSTVQKPAAAQRCPVDKYGNNLNKPDRAAQ